MGVTAAAPAVFVVPKRVSGTRMMVSPGCGCCVALSSSICRQHSNSNTDSSKCIVRDAVLHNAEQQH